MVFEIINDITYSESTNLTCNLFIPDSTEPLPVVINLFGGGWEEGDKQYQTPISQSLANEGYAAIAMDYRLAPKNKYPAQLDDIKDVLRFVKNNAGKYNLDVNRICITGFSAGGHLAVLSAMLLYDFNPKIKCAISFHGPMDLVAFSNYNLENSDEIKWAQRLVHQLIGGNLDELSQNVKQASPYHLATSKSVPVLFISSKNDPLVPYQPIQKTAEKLEELGVYTKFLLHDSDFHGNLDPNEVVKRGWDEMWSQVRPPRLMFHEEVIEFLEQNF